MARGSRGAKEARRARPAASRPGGRAAFPLPDAGGRARPTEAAAQAAHGLRRAGSGRRGVGSQLLGLVLLWALVAPPALAEEPEPGAVLAELPFLERGAPGEVFVDLAPPGSRRRLPLQLDTGASSSALSPDLARELGIRERGRPGRSHRRATRLGRDLEFFVAQGSSPVDFGLLGGNFLRHYVVEIDWASRRVRFLDPERFEVPETITDPAQSVLTTRLVGNRPLVEILVAGRPLSVLLDTGATFGLTLGPEEAEARGLEAQPAPGLDAVGAHGPIEIEFVELESVVLGSIRFEGVPAVVAPRGLRQQATSNDSLLGQDLLATSLLRIDYPRARVWLRPRPGARPRFLGASWGEVRRSGALLYRRGRWIQVGVVLPGRPAADLGLAPGDVLEEVDPRASDFDPRAAHARLASGAAIRVRRIDERGRERVLTLGPLASSGRSAAGSKREADGPAPAPGD